MIVGADTSFSESIRTTVNTAGIYIGPIVTNDEIDFLLDGDPEDMAAYHTSLAHEMIHRTTGFRVELNAEGAAAHVMARAGKSEHQEHNTIVTTHDLSKARAFDPDLVRAGSVPKITPDDANAASKSIDFPAKRASGTPLDNLRVTPHDNPSEKSFIAEITVLQVLSHFGMDVSELIEFVNVEWGIDYVEELVRNVALAPVKELDLYLASGGRQAPSIYVSPNVMSFYRIAQGFNIDLEAADATGMFIGRARELARFTHFTVNACRGPRALVTLSMHASPGSLTRFSPDDLVGKKVTVGLTPALVPDRASIPGLSSYENFVDKRVAAAVAIKVDAVRLGDEMRAIDGVPKARKSVGFQRMIDDSKGDIMSSVVNIAHINNPAINTSAPRRLQAVLLSHFHNPVTGDTLNELNDTSYVLTFLGTCTLKAEEYAQYWGIISNSRGFATVLRSINLANAKKNAELNALMASVHYVEERRFAVTFLLSRCLSSMRPNLIVAWEEVHGWITTGEAPTAVSNPSHKWSGGVPLILRMFDSVAGEVHDQDPFKRKRYIRQQVASTLAKSSVLNMDVHALVNAMKADQNWNKYHDVAKRKVSADKYTEQRMRPIFASIRNGYVSFYASNAMTRVSNAYIVSRMFPSVMVSENLVPIEPRDHMVMSDVMYNASMVEACHNLGKAAAFKFCKVAIHDLDFDGYPDKDMDPIDLLKATVDHYEEILTHGSRPLVVVDGKVSAFTKESALTKYCKFNINSFLSHMIIPTDVKELSALKKHLFTLVKSSYTMSIPIVEHSFQEAVNRDYEFVADKSSGIRSSTIPLAEPAGAEETKGDDDSEEPDAVLNVGETVDISTLVATLPTYLPPAERTKHTNLISHIEALKLFTNDKSVVQRLDDICAAVPPRVFAQHEADLDGFSAQCKTAGFIAEHGMQPGDSFVAALEHIEALLNITALKVDIFS